LLPVDWTLSTGIDMADALNEEFCWSDLVEPAE